MENYQRVITVTKTVGREFDADRVHIAVRTEGEGKTAKDAARAENAVAQKLKTVLDGFDGVVAALDAVRYSRTVRDGKPAVYSACRSCTVETDCDAEKLAALTDAIADIGLNASVSFSLEDRSARNELIARAVTEARADAQTIAAAAGVKLAALVRAEYASAPAARPMLLRAAAHSFSDGVAEPQRVTLEETVICSWEFI